MVYFNSLRELGTSLSLLQSDIPDYLRVIQNRVGLRPAATRRSRICSRRRKAGSHRL